MRLFGKGLSLVLLFWVSAGLNAASYWQDMPAASQRLDQSLPLVAKASEARHLQADVEAIRQQLLSSDSVDIELPLPNGQMAIYHFELSPIAAQDLLDKFPEIRTFKGTDVTNSANSGRFDISHLGFRGMFRHDGQLILIDPQYIGNTEHYITYNAKHAQRLSPSPDDQVETNFAPYLSKLSQERVLAKGSSDGSLRTYRLAVAATQQYTNAVAPGSVGTVADGIAGITTAINRVNEIYERDLGIRLELVANNDAIVYTNSKLGAYANNGSFAELSLNQTNINAVIGPENYDIGHLFGTGLGGVASLGVVCDDDSKARGLTGLNDPTGDLFYVDFVAHEIGHQFGANHTFNGSSSLSGSCNSGNRNSSTAYEPGSGSTVMAYAGICISAGVTEGSPSDQNLQYDSTDTEVVVGTDGASDPYFHAGSIEEITRFVTTGNYSVGGTLISGEGDQCGSMSAMANAAPDASAGPDVTIPANTPFILSGSATDANVSDELTYVWEQMDVGTASSDTSEWIDDSSRTIFRSLLPTTSSERYLPRLDNILDGYTSHSERGDYIRDAEFYPITNRDLNFRLTVRDGQGGTAFENKAVTVTTTAGPFRVTAPISGNTWTAGTATVTWDVANTSGGSVNCSNVNIALKSDNNNVFAYDLRENGSNSLTFANDGSATINVPYIDTSDARVMVSCADNIFFAVNPDDFNVSALSTAISSIAAASATEGDSMSFAVTLASAAGSKNYSFAIENVSTSSADIDLGSLAFSNGVISNNGVLTVPNDVSSFTLSFDTVSDSVVEARETLTLYLGGSTATGTIIDTSVGVDSISQPVAIEGEELEFTVALTDITTAPQNLSMTVTLLTASNTDFSGFVYSGGVTESGGILTVPSGLSSFTVTATAFDDDSDETSVAETFRLTIDGVSALGTIVDNDSPESSGGDSSGRSGGGGGGSMGLFSFALLSLLILSRIRRRSSL